MDDRGHSGDLTVAIIGAGFSGLSVAHYLRQYTNIQSFVVYESSPRTAGGAGTWKDNTYPGCACDIPIYLYEMSWAKRKNWSEYLPLQPEIQEYLDEITHEKGLYRHIQFATQLVEARWLDSEHMWSLKMRNASPNAPNDAFFTVKHHVVVMACGPLSQPRMPEGVDTSIFQGEQFHSQKWRHDTIFEGKNVAIVGNGCSATQFMPIISRRCKSVTQYISSPHWLVPRSNWLYTERQKWIFENIPGASLLYRYYLAYTYEKEGYKLKAGAGPEKLRQQVEIYFKAHLEEHAPKKYLKQLTPDFPVGCKRLVLDSNYLDCLHAENVDLAFTRVSEVTENGIVGKDGSRREFDIIIWATGFLATLPFQGIKIYGRSGQELHDRWKVEGHPTAYLGLASKDLPNLYMTTGPNTFSGHTSITQIIEKQAMWIAQMLKLQLDNKVQSFEITPRAEAEWAKFLRQEMAGRVWTSSACNSWFKGKDGFVATNFPGSTMKYFSMIWYPNMADVKQVGGIRKVRGTTIRWELQKLALQVALVAMLVRTLWQRDLGPKDMSKSLKSGLGPIFQRGSAILATVFRR